MRKKGKLSSLLALVLSCSMVLPSMTAFAQTSTTEAVTESNMDTEQLQETEEIQATENLEETATNQNAEKLQETQVNRETQAIQEPEDDQVSEAAQESEAIQSKAKKQDILDSEMDSNYKGSKKSVRENDNKAGVGTDFVKTETSREQVNFNREWKFIRSDIAGAEGVEYDDSQWVDIGIPHNFSIPYEMTSTFYVGYGWYRKEFDVPQNWDNKKVELEFEGVFQVADIYVNGVHVGTHEGGYTGFVYDITDKLQTGKNLVAVRVNNIWQPDLAPRAGDHQYTGGIYRDVYLNVTEDVHVAWYGTFVTTPDLNNPAFDASAKNISPSYTSEDEIRANIAAKRSNVNVNTEVKNESTSPKLVKVHQQVVDKKGKVVADFESAEQTIQAGKTAFIDATSSQIQNIELWSTENPYVYKVYTTVYSEGKAVDTYESPLGFRWAQYKNDGFYLNGVKTLLDGANVHQDHAGFADAVTNEGFARDVAMVKETGMNFIRGSHYPHDPSFAKACDEQGMMFWSEATFWGMGGCDGLDDPATYTSKDWLKDPYPQNPADEENFEQSCKDALTAMIRVNRNHPSIINWSMGNEAFFTKGGMPSSDPNVKGTEFTAPQALKLVDEMRNLSHSLDPTRKAGMGGVQRGGYANLDTCDIAGYNGDGGKFQNNTMPHIVAEYGSKTADRPGEYRPFYDQIQGGSNTEYVLQPNSAGLVLWCAFHHGTVGGDGLAKMGMIDYYRLPLKSWYWYREKNLGTAPEASISGKATQMELTTSDETITNDGRKDTKLILTMQNADGAWVNESKAVTLTVESGPGILPGGKTYKFVPNKSIRDGKASIEFRSYYSGDTVISAQADGLPKSSITIHTEAVLEENGTTEPEGFYDASKWGDLLSKIEEPMIYGGNNVVIGRPLTVSSNEADRTLGADGDISTSWVAATRGSNESFMVDLEFPQYIYKIKAGFDRSPYPFKIEIAGDEGTDWTTVADYTSETVSMREAEESLDGLYAKFVKVTFTDVPEDANAFLSELEVYGNTASVSPQYTQNSVYLSDVVDFKNVTTFYGQKGKDVSCEGNPITIAGMTYKKGIGLHADSMVPFTTDGKYTRISGVAGIDSEVAGGNALFKIMADGKIIYSKELSGGDMDEFDLSISGVMDLRLITEQNGSESQDHTDWADVKLHGAIRNTSKYGTGIQSSYVGMTQKLQAGEDFTGILDLKNNSAEQKQFNIGLSIYNKEGRLQKYEMKTVSLDPSKGQKITMTIPMSSDINGQKGVVSIWDAETLELLAQNVAITPDPDKLTDTGGSTETKWTKVDGELMDKVGNWDTWAGEGSYQGTETFIGETTNPIQPGDNISYTFTGSYVKVGVKFDTTQRGADVFIDGTKVGTINNQTTGTINEYKEAFSSENLGNGSHTIKLVPLGKFGVDYVEYGVEKTEQPDPGEDEEENPILTAMGGLTTTIEEGQVNKYTFKSRKNVSEVMSAAYTVYVKEDATQEEIQTAITGLERVITGLTLRDQELEAALDSLQKALTQAKAILDKGQGNYTNLSWQQLNDLYQAGNAASKGEDSIKAEVKKAEADLTAAIQTLELRADKAKLQKAVNDAKAIIDKGQANYTPESFTNLKNAYTEGNTILGKLEPTLSEMDAAVAKINSSIAGLQQMKPDTSLADARKVLETEVTAAQAIVNKGQKYYTDSSWKKLKDTLASAKSMLVNPKATKDNYLSSANALKAAQAGLASYKVPKSGAKYTVGNLKYKVSKSSATSGTVIVTGAKSKTQKSVSIPSTVTINRYKFKVTAIDKKAFYKNKKLKTVVIGSNVTKIGDSAFAGNTALTSVTIGAKVTSIGSNAFSGDKKLKTINIKSSSLKSVGKNAFKGIYTKAKIKVPSKKLNAYKKLLKNKGQSKSVNIVK